MAEDARKQKVFRKRARDDSDDDESGSSRPSGTSAPALGAAQKRALNVFSTRRADAAAAVSASSSREVVNDVAAVPSTRSAAPHEYGGGAFTELDVDTSRDRDARAVLEKALAMQNTSIEALESGVKVYRGMAGYGNFIPRDAETASRAKVTGTHGPLRAPTNVRGIVRIDYQPDICKDYKETGFCGFGDSCKFLHDRGDYKMGWQIDREYEEEQRRKAAALAAKVAGGGSADEDEEGGDAGAADVDDGLPFACHICREPFKSPVQTQCGHYFCEKCAVQRYARNPLCAICNKPTHGIFNAATKLEAKLRARAADGRDAAEEKAGRQLANASKSASSQWTVVESTAVTDSAPDAGHTAAVGTNGDAAERQYITSFGEPDDTPTP